MKKAYSKGGNNIYQCNLILIKYLIHQEVGIILNLLTTNKIATKYKKLTLTEL